MFVCHKCIQEAELNFWIKAVGKRNTCSFCMSKLKCLPLDIIIDRVDSVYKVYYKQGNFYPDTIEESNNPIQKQEGEDPITIISDLIQCDRNIAEKIVNILWDREKYSVLKDGNEAFYDKDSKYVRFDDYPYDLHETWLKFQDRIRFKKRFFDEEAKEMLHNLLFIIEPFAIGINNPSPFLTLSQFENKQLRIFRARTADTWDEVEKIKNDPISQIGPPPRQESISGRMNPQGISVFYGALSEKTCISEVRPAVGSFVLVAEFEVIRRQKILDLTVFNKIPDFGSIFRNDYSENVRKWRFLHDFQLLISKPILLIDEPLEYLATQAVVEYLIEMHDIDGIIYNSSQTKMSEEESEEDNRNIAIFDGLEILENDKMSNKQKNFDLNKINDHSFPKTVMFPTLRYKKESISVYKINSVVYNYTLASKFDNDMQVKNIELL